jgi:antitoxin MazE
MQVQIQKWGNSLALRIPKSLAVDSRIQQGSVVELSLVEGKLVVVPVRGKAYKLDDLLAGVTDENRHGEIDTGGTVGGEAW